MKREPVLVIHGVNTRLALESPAENEPQAKAKFAEGVLNLDDALGEHWELVPVYWGDLGVNIASLRDILPNPDKQSKSKLEWLAGGIWQGTGRYAAFGVKAASGELKKALAWFKGDKDGVDELDAEIEEAAQTFMNQSMDYWWELFAFLRHPISLRLLPFIGDILIYQTSEGREMIQGRMKQALTYVREEFGLEYGTRERPISIIAHSLGGVICFDMAVHENPLLWINKFITLGSQPSLFHLILARRYAHLKISPDTKCTVLPETIADWTNLVSPFDVLSFTAAKSFRLHDGRKPTDVVLKLTLPMSAHSAYWEDDEVAGGVAAISAALNSGPRGHGASHGAC